MYNTMFKFNIYTVENIELKYYLLGLALPFLPFFGLGGCKIRNNHLY